MEKVTGIGGLFFKARDPKALAEWYEHHLGVSQLPMGPGQTAWQQQAGATAFAPFPEDTKYFKKPWMINFRVANLDRMVEQLKTLGIAVEVDAQAYPNGRFARLHDPEDNPIELWEPLP